MKIYFAGSIRGGRSILFEYQQIIALLKKSGHDVVSEHVASSKLEEVEAKLTDEEIFKNDIGFIDECDCVVADVTVPSIGVGYEISYAVSRGKRVLCLYKEGTNVSAMVIGNRRVRGIPYLNISDLEKSLPLHLEKMISPDLKEKAMKYYDDFKEQDFVVKPSLPILYFGDIEAYFDSEIKIITVGKNPSGKEFELSKSGNSFSRFPEWNESRHNLTQILNNYFKKEPYRNWFNSYEPILNGADCSFYHNKKYKNRAIHTDMCSPLATKPTWSKLDDGKQKLLFERGFELWELLLKELQPDVILISVPHGLFKKVVKSEGTPFHTIGGNRNNGNLRKPYEVYEHVFKINETKSARVFYGQAANTPFGTISNQESP